LEVKKITRRAEVIKKSTAGHSNDISLREGKAVEHVKQLPLTKSSGVSVHTKKTVVKPIQSDGEHDIDSQDKDNQFSCWQYASEIHKYYLEVEVIEKACSSHSI